ncbi:helix-turn-helix domain-containing protein [Pelagibacterium sediminicola]|uniref:helix-turn-helix domain-containing protein n=1 Tax=Pelagibacterium sediminicola TaxID=2248761 RepID=UPI000E3104D4|nr:helix-turn-helix transcriptional regulator [Pelagibacterium sediminicola]
MMTLNSVPQRLKALRIERKWSQYRLAAEIGCNQSTVHRIETGELVPRGAIKKMIEVLLGAHEVAPEKAA